MKNVILLFLLSSLFLGTSKYTHAQDNDNLKRQKFISKFTGAVDVKKKRKIIKAIDETYVTQNLDEKYKGNKSEFLAYFFAGNIEKTNEFSKVPLAKIFGIRLVELNELQAGIAECKFLLRTSEGVVQTTLYLKSLEKKGKFAFVPKGK